MNQTYTAVIKQGGAWWIGWIEDARRLLSEPTREDLLETLRTTLEEALEFNRREARETAGEGFEGIPIAG